MGILLGLAACLVGVAAIIFAVGWAVGEIRRAEAQYMIAFAFADEGEPDNDETVH